MFAYVYHHSNSNTGDELKAEYRVEQGKNHSCNTNYKKGKPDIHLVAI